MTHFQSYWKDFPLSIIQICTSQERNKLGLYGKILEYYLFSPVHVLKIQTSLYVYLNFVTSIHLFSPSLNLQVVTHTIILKRELREKKEGYNGIGVKFTESLII